MSRYSRTLRHEFFVALGLGLKVVWPILSGLIGTVIALGIIVGLLENWPLFDSIYFAFITGLTIGYGDLVPTRPLTQVLSIVIGFSGLALGGLVAALAVKSFQRSMSS